MLLLMAFLALAKMLNKFFFKAYRFHLTLIVVEIGIDRPQV